MSDIRQPVVAPKEISGWVCIAIGVGFVAGLVGLIVLARVFGGS